MLFQARTLIALVALGALGALVGFAGRALDFSGWAWYAAAVAALLLATLTDRDGFYGHEHRRVLR